MKDRPEERAAELLRERRAQVRGLLVLALLLLGLLVWRAVPMGVFHAGWWRL